VAPAGANRAVIRRFFDEMLNRQGLAGGEGWETWDRLGLLQQLGVLAAPGVGRH